MNLPKPPKCDQDWLNMSKIEGGRICNKCQKKIHDFRKKSWTEIEDIQKANNYGACGTYTKKQLNHWGKDPIGHSFSGQAILLSSLLFGTPLNAESSAEIPIDRVDTEHIKSPMGKLIATEVADSTFYILKGKVIDADSEEGLPFVDIQVIKGGVILITTKSDIDGNYSIQLHENIPRTGLKVQFNYVGYQSLSYENVHFPENMSPDETLFLDAKLQGGEGIVYSVEYPSKWRRFWWRVGNIFRK